MEFGVDYDVKCAFLGRPIASIKDDVDFWYEAGYDYIPMQAGIRTLFWPGHSSSEKVADKGRETGNPFYRRTTTRYSIYTEGEREMAWAAEASGVIASMEDFERFPWPDPDRMDLSHLDEARAWLRPGMKVIVIMGYIFTAAWWLMGMENFCIALHDQPELIRRLYQRIWAIQSAVVLRVLKHDAVGGILHPDDLAYSEALILSPKHFREFVFPWYRWCGAVVHDAGRLYLFHSDGRLTSVLEDIIGCGFDAMHPVEPKAMDIVELKKQIAGRLSLIGNIDLGYTLTRGTPQEVDDEVRERIRALAPGGGYGVSSSNSVTAYVPLANYNAMREAAFKYGTYPVG